MDENTGDLAQLVVAAWVLGLQGSSRGFPTDRRLLDRALKRAIDSGAFPGMGFEFVATGEALVCVQGQSIIDQAQDAGLTSTPNPSYSHSDPKIGPRGARHLLRDLGVAETDAAAWARQLQNALTQVRAEHARPRVPA